MSGVVSSSMVTIRYRYGAVTTRDGAVTIRDGAVAIGNRGVGRNGLVVILVVRVAAIDGDVFIMMAVVPL